MYKKMLALALCLAAVMSLTACAAEQSSKSDSSKLQVSVSFNAIKEFAQAVGGDKVEISTIIPDGMEPHDFEPKAQDLVKLSSADVFIYNGLGMEAWAADAVSAADNKSLIAVDASQGAEVITNTDADEKSEHGQYDPHLWLSLKGAETEVTNIRDAFVQADPDNANYYNTNCANYIAQLESLYTEYSGKFETVEKKNFVTGHAAFSYLCRDFGLHQNSVEDVFAEGEPSAQQLTELVKYCKANAVTTIFAEEMASPDVSATLASEVGAKVVTIYTVESAEDNLSYLDRMEYNLNAIYTSLNG
jgi:zinc transport system substrate-binding protein